ncbi:MAG: hypothetical protein NT018_13190 [Armatimonadetes bacterium]|nr:hypothetical protein [Armatimonadota bacterium]
MNTTIIIPHLRQDVRRGVAILICAALLINVLFCANPSLAQDTPAVTGAPASVVGGTGTASPAPEDVLTRPTVQIPNSGVAPPVAPSEPPTGYTPTLITPVAEIPTDFICVTGDNVRTTFKDGKPAVTTADANVTTYKNTVTTAQSARVNYETNIAEFGGGVVFRIDEQEIRGESLTLNLKTREWALRKASTAIEPQFVRGYLCAPVFVLGESIEGIGRKSITAINSETTTCNLTIPHYELRSRSITVYPERRIVLRNVAAYALGHRLFALNYLVIPLRNVPENPNLIPRFGQSVEEGFYMKSAYAYTGTATQAGFLLLDLMSRKGIGTGIRHQYQLNRGLGDVQIYRLEDQTINQTTLTGRLNHTQRIGDVDVLLTSNFRNNSYIYAPQSKSINNLLSLTRNTQSANSSLTISQGIDDVFVQTKRLNANLTHRQTLANRALLNSNFIYNSFGGTNTPNTARLTSQASVSQAGPRFDWSLSAQKIDDLSAESFVGGGRFGGIERLPELAISSDTTKLGNFLLFGAPANLKLAFGEYNELPSTNNIGRAYFEIGTPSLQHKLTDTWTLNTTSGFRQFAYSDNTAQYSLYTNTGLSKKLGQSSTFNLAYRFQEPRGFTPFRFDYVGKYNTLNAGLSIKESERFKLNVLSGYNFEQKQFPWQDAIIRCSIQPSENFLLYTATGYDINRKEWRTLINQMRVRIGDNFRFDLGTRYDAVAKKLAMVRPQLDTTIGNKTRIQAVAGYNGFTNAFDYRSFMLTRDLHCWEASLVYTNQTGFYQNKSLMLYMRIKAFPVFRQFGVGTFGQAQDTSVGDVY